MKNQKIKTLSNGAVIATSLIINLLISSCTDNYTYNINNIESRMVVSSFINPDSIIKVSLVIEAGLNENIFENWFETIDGADLLLFENDILYDTLNQDSSGMYISDKIIHRNNTYAINCTAYGLDPVNANNTIPKHLTIDTIEFKLIKEFTNVYLAKMKFTDPPEEGNKYIIDYGDAIRSITYEDPVFDDWDANHGGAIPIFSDELFNGQTYELTFQVNTRIQPAYTGSLYGTITLHHISEDFYQYAKSYNKQIPKMGDDLLQMFQAGLVEPIPIYSNVQGGLGIFAGFSSDMDSLYFGDKLTFK